MSLRKKYNELLEREKTCSEELAKYKKMSLDYESLAKELEMKFDLANKDLIKMRKDTAMLGEKLRLLNREYKIVKRQAEELENSFNKLTEFKRQRDCNFTGGAQS